MLVIGVTGGSGCGKSLFCQHLGRLSQAPILDADRIYHELIRAPSACTAALAEAFGSDILNQDGSLNRPSLAAIVFANTPAAKDRLAQLNEITHRFVRTAFEQRLQDCKKQNVPLVILDAPLLFEAEFDKLCHHTVGVLAEQETRLLRIMERDHIDRDAALRRLHAQPPDTYYKERCDLIVYNNGDIDDICKAAVKVMQNLNIRYDSK